MNGAAKFSDETLMAYADGELDADTRAQIESAMAGDAELSRKVAEHRVLRSRMRAAFDPVLDEPVPERLMEAARSAPAGAPADTVTHLAAARATRTARAQRRWSWPEWGAMAASLTLGVVVSYAVLTTRTDTPIVARNGQLVAEGALASALSQQLAQEQASADAVQMGPSFVSDSDEYCRTFVMREGDEVAGLACREQSQWKLHMLVRGTAATASDGYRMAGSAMPRILMEAVENEIAGEPLDAQGEAEARQRGWQ